MHRPDRCHQIKQDTQLDNTCTQTLINTVAITIVSRKQAKFLLLYPCRKICQASGPDSVQGLFPISNSFLFLAFSMIFFILYYFIIFLMFYYFYYFFIIFFNVLLLFFIFFIFFILLFFFPKVRKCENAQYGNWRHKGDR